MIDDAGRWPVSGDRMEPETSGATTTRPGTTGTLDTAISSASCSASALSLPAPQLVFGKVSPAGAVAVEARIFFTSSTVSLGFFCSMSAATPAMCGEAMLVPLALALALRQGLAAQATVPLEKARRLEPEKASIREALGIAYFRLRRYKEAEAEFRAVLDISPVNDYAHYGLGLSLWRLQRFPAARDHLAMASVMRPQRADYAQALAQVRATLKAREEAGLPLEGPVSE